MKWGDAVPASVERAIAILPAPAHSADATAGIHTRRRSPPAVEVVHATPTRIRLRAGGLNAAKAVALTAALKAAPNVQFASANPLTGSIIVRLASPAASRTILNAVRSALADNPPRRRSQQDTAWHAISAAAV